MNLENEIKEIVSNVIQVPVQEISDNASFIDDYGMDSLRILEILAEIENKYKITINPEDIKKMVNVSGVIELTQFYMKRRNE